ncbi:MAG TPA: LuxR C-terminal-related transcriptional regulator [Polyangiales bacterium]|nr:LuxR C-terminal-related transcriptional regulator [Polyangiales bacterium]
MSLGPEKLSLGILDILEVLYAVEMPREQWIAQLLATTAKALRFGRGVAVSLYCAPLEDSVRLDLLESLEAPDGLCQTGVADHASPVLSRVFSSLYRSRMLSNWQDLESHGDDNLDERMGRHGIRDKWMVNGINPSGMGCALWAFAKEEHPLSAGERRLLRKLAPHLAVSYRLWIRHAGLDAGSRSPVEAVLGLSGKLEHAEAAAKPKEARTALLESAKLRDWARSCARRHAPERAVSAWRGLAAARWSFVDVLESDGKRYVLARENVPDSSAQPMLSGREQQVAALARLGRSNKVIAYELGLSASTVRVLMARAARKLGVRSRSALVERLDRTDGTSAERDR